MAVRGRVRQRRSVTCLAQYARLKTPSTPVPDVLARPVHSDVRKHTKPKQAVLVRGIGLDTWE